MLHVGIYILLTIIVIYDNINNNLLIKLLIKCLKQQSTYSNVQCNRYSCTHTPSIILNFSTRIMILTAQPRDVFLKLSRLERDNNYVHCPLS